MGELSTAINDVNKVSSYYSSLYGREYDLLASFKSDGGVDNLYIQVQGETLIDMVVFIMSGEQLSLFSDAIRQIKSKYLQWCEIAKDNNVKNFCKVFDVIFPDVAIGWYEPNKYKWYFDMNHKLIPYFMVLNTGQSYSLVITGDALATVESLKNEVVGKEYGFALSSESDFEIFLREVDPINLLLMSAEKTLESYEKIRKYKDTEKLFK